jgi:cytosine/adenosine deaminase-related metal-dependent hydrolase
MRLALHLHHASQLGAAVSSPAEVLSMATSAGARVLGRGGELGRLPVGMAADLVVVDLARASWPYRAPEVDPLAFLLQRACAGDVSDVLVDGALVLAAGRPTRFDFDALGESLGRDLAAAPFPDAVRRSEHHAARPHSTSARGLSFATARPGSGRARPGRRRG